MSNTKIISELIIQFEAYEQEVKLPTLAGFAAWIHKQTNRSEIEQRLQIGNADAVAVQKVNELDNAIGILLGMMNKYARLYSKIAMGNLPLNTVEEFGYLAQLSSHEQLTKTALIAKSMDGKTTGMDIIRRLVQQGLAKEVDNPEDKRSKLLRITAKGKKTVGLSYIRMSAVSKAVVGNLTVSEKQHMLAALNKLAQHHQQHEAEIGENLRKL